MTSSPTTPLLILDPAVRIFQGCAYGMDRPTLVTLISLRRGMNIDLNLLDEVMTQWLGHPYPDQQHHENDQGLALMARLNHWQLALQAEYALPVFGAGSVQEQRVTTPTSLRRFQLAAPYVHPQVSKDILSWLVSAVNLAETATAEAGETLMASLSSLKANLRLHTLQGINMAHLLRASHELGMRWHQLYGNYFAIGLGANSRWLNSTITDQTPNMGVAIAKSKVGTAAILRKSCLPVPRHIQVASEKEALAAARQMGFPVVIKPSDMDQGQGVFAGLCSEASLLSAYRVATSFSPRILVEKHHHGEDYRVTVAHGEVIKVMHRQPGRVIGDGVSTIAELVAEAQRSPEHQRTFRRTGKMRLQLDDEAMELLAESQLNAGSVPNPGEVVTLRRKSNISSGGTHRLVAQQDVHPDNQALAIRATDVLGLDIAGIDLIIPDIGQSWLQSDAIICEVNSQPQLGYRDTPEIYKNLLRALVPCDGQIPVHILITSDQTPTHIQATVQRLAEEHGCNGIATADGYWVDGVQQGWQPGSDFLAAQGLLLDRRLRGAVVALDARSIVNHGLPAPDLASVSALAPVSTNQQALSTLNAAKMLVKIHRDERIRHRPSLTPESRP